MHGLMGNDAAAENEAVRLLQRTMGGHIGA